MTYYTLLYGLVNKDKKHFLIESVLKLYIHSSNVVI